MATDRPKITFSVGAVLPAAGCGERMKLATPKQFCEVNGRPLICYTIDCFHRLPWIQNIVISTDKAYVDLVRNLISRYGFSKVTVVIGGTTRHRSIHAAVKALQQVAVGVEVVVVHDAVRPVVSADILEKITLAAYSCGAAGVCRPLVSTVFARDENLLMTGALNRSQYWNSEMPQAFQVPVISSAYDKCTSDEFEFGTECLQLPLKYGGVRAKILDGDADLWKVTYKKDLFTAEAVLKERLTKVKIMGREWWPDLADSMKARLCSLQYMVTDEPICEAGESGDMKKVISAVNTFVVIHQHLNTSDADQGLKMNNKVNIEMNHPVSQDDKSPVQGVSSANLVSSQHTKNVIPPNPLSASVTRNATDGRKDLENVLMYEQNKLLLPSTPVTPMVDTTFLHVFVTASESEADRVHTILSKALLKLSTRCQESSVLVYGVLITKETSVQKTSELLSSIIQRGHRHFSGQLFLVD